MSNTIIVSERRRTWPDDPAVLKAMISERDDELYAKSLLIEKLKHQLAIAMRYTITRLNELEVYLENGQLEIDHNATERSMKNLAVGKKNYLFAGSDKGGERAATIYSLIEIAKLNGVNPQSWLAHVINTIQDYPEKRIDDLLPWNWTSDDL